MALSSTPIDLSEELWTKPIINIPDDSDSDEE